MVEIGNYDGFYAEGRVFSAEEVLKLTKRTRLISSVFFFFSLKIEKKFQYTTKLSSFFLVAIIFFQMHVVADAAL